MAQMASTCIVILLFVMIFYATTISAFNITKLLNNYPEFSTFNDLLTKTGLADNINEREAITVLVVDNAGMGPITGMPENTIKKLISTHALLQYFDMNTLSVLPKDGSVAANFFQNSGIASKGQGQTRVSASGGQVMFASDAEGAPQDAKMVKVVTTQQPYIISVIQLSQPIVTPGLDQTTSSAPLVSPKAAPPAMAMAPSPKSENGTMAPAEVPAKVAAAPKSESPSAAAPKSESPSAAAPKSESPSAARKLSPGAGGPGLGPALGPRFGPGAAPASAPAPVDSMDDKDAPPKMILPKNGGTQVAVGVVGGLISALMVLLALSV